MKFDTANDDDHMTPKPLTDVYTEVRVRQFFKGPDGVEVLPTFVYFLKDGKGDVKHDEVIAGIAKSVQEQVPFKLQAMEVREIGEWLASEITVGSAVGSQAKASLSALPKPKPPKLVGIEPPLPPDATEQ